MVANSFEFRCWPSETGGQRRSRLPAAVVPLPGVWRVPARGCNRYEVAAPALGQASSISTRARRAQESEPAAAAVEQTA